VTREVPRVIIRLELSQLVWSRKLGYWNPKMKAFHVLVPRNKIHDHLTLEHDVPAA